MNRKLKRVLYIISVVVLFGLGIVIWYMQAEVSEIKTFTINHQREAEFELNSEIPIPKRMEIQFEGKLDCDALLILKSMNESVKSRNTFPLKAGSLDDKKLECKWHSSDVLVVFKSSDCETEKLKIILNIIE